MPLSSAVGGLGHGESWDSGDRIQTGRRYSEVKDELSSERKGKKMKPEVCGGKCWTEHE